MKVKPTNPATAAGLIDPDTKRSPFIAPDTGRLRESAEVPETIFWTRRLMAGEIERVDEPTGLEPVAPLTTRGK
jgi:hypothetical protein